MMNVLPVSLPCRAHSGVSAGIARPARSRLREFPVSPPAPALHAFGVSQRAREDSSVAGATFTLSICRAQFTDHQQSRPYRKTAKPRRYAPAPRSFAGALRGTLSVRAARGKRRRAVENGAIIAPRQDRNPKRAHGDAPSAGTASRRPQRTVKHTFQPGAQRGKGATATPADFAAPPFYGTIISSKQFSQPAAACRTPTRRPRKGGSTP